MQEGSSALDIFLSSDWDSIRSGAIWIEEIERALSTCRHFVALITSAEDARSPWVNYEVGYARGKDILPRIFLFDGITPEEVPYPLRMLHLILPGDTNRRRGELDSMGVSDSKNAFAALLYARTEVDADATRKA